MGLKSHGMVVIQVCLTFSIWHKCWSLCALFLSEHTGIFNDPCALSITSSLAKQIPEHPTLLFICFRVKNAVVFWPFLLASERKHFERALLRSRTALYIQYVCNDLLRENNMFLGIIQDWAHNQHPEENKKEQKHPELAAVCCADNDTTYLSL